MIDITKAIYQRAMASSTLTALISDRFYESEGPQNSGLPYVVYSVTSTVNSSTFTEEMDSGRVTFLAVSQNSSSTEIKTILAALNTLFDKAAFLTESSGKMEVMNRVTRFWDKIRTEDDKEEWNGLLDFEILHQTY